MTSSNGRSIKLRISSQSSVKPSPSSKVVEPKGTSEETESIEDVGVNDAQPVVVDKETQRIRDAKRRHEADTTQYRFEPSQAARLEDDWQVAYVWAFIVKFNLRGKIARLENLEDFERCLTQPVANRPDDVLESTLICFLSNLRPGLRNLTCENIQSHVSNYITDMLTTTSEWTVWDRPWPINEEDRGACCSSNPHRAELGRLRYYGEPSGARARRNPIREAEERGGGLFELDWRARAKLLRQMVDWQLNHSEHIRFIVNREYKVPEGKGKKPVAEAGETNTILVEPLGQNRDRARVWSLDDSWRLYKSGNPYKRPCPMVTVTSTKAEYEAWIQGVDEYSSRDPASNGTGKGGKETSEQKKLAKAMKDEKALAENAKERVPEIEKEEARVLRARRKIAQVVQMQQQAEMRSTRTRRQTRKVDYLYDDGDDDFEDEGQPSRNGRVSTYAQDDTFEYDHRGRPVIPGERRSARMSGRTSGANLEVPSSSYPPSSGDEVSDGGTVTPTTAESSLGLAAGTGTGFNEGEAGDDHGRKKKRKGMKGYAWVEEVVPFEKLSDKDKERVLAERQEAAAAAAAAAVVEDDSRSLKVNGIDQVGRGDQQVDKQGDENDIKADENHIEEEARSADGSVTPTAIPITPQDEALSVKVEQGKKELEVMDVDE